MDVADMLEMEGWTESLEQTFVTRVLPVLPSDWTFLSHPDWDRRSSRLRCSRVGSSDPQPAPGRRGGCRWRRGGWSRGPNRHLKHEEACIVFCIKHADVSGFYFRKRDAIRHWDARIKFRLNSFLDCLSKTLKFSLLPSNCHLCCLVETVFLCKQWL